jgi:two-component system OmpR family sensor kinase
MSLQTKLTLLFTGLIGGTLAILGLLVFGLVNVILIDQIDMRLAITGQRMINQLTVNHENQIVINQLRMDNTLVQIWKNSSELIISNPPDMKNPLHENGLRLGENNYDTGTLQGVRIRVLTVPLKTSRGPVGILQVALDLSLLDITLKTLAAVLVSMLLIGLIVSSILSWFFTKKTLTPLMTVTNFARDITKTHDLSRRIPVDSDQSQDEVGQLISAFNETLSRLDQILVSQKQLVADISHELRTPLTVIKGEVGLMKNIRSLMRSRW